MYRKFLKTSCRLLAALSLGMTLAHAQVPFPNKVVRIVVPYAAGGVTDIMARVLAQQLSTQMGQQFIVENKPGAGGSIGMGEVARLPKDGYNLVMMPANLSVMSALYEKLPFDPLKDFVPVANVGSSPVGISVASGGSVANKLPVKNIRELLAYAKKNSVSYASCGIASPQHIAAEYLKSVAQIELVHIPYKGCGAALPDVLSHEVPLFFASIPHLINNAKSGRILPIAVTGKKRSPLLPDVPTIAESGYPQFDVEAWFGIIAAKGTPADVVNKLNAEINKALRSPEMKKTMAAQYFEPVGGTAESFGATINRDAQRLGAIVKQAGIRAE
ncbi:MAG: tripartite tricarboxylate transporter substrate binding protein [Polaromonas sp.]|uniref:Bug family tripartite tricarboxylate transporter substrate binding protein n=1 Tax=Polaromonas sp. TaxID=1869339 RepID=UPI0025EA5311|nr:tripartite tricarboxylate transporter substrate binding protein [Polaromonas sp.]MBI2729016.1 tripartite tricarboxylate transporter substrate binding protein [Polaromonas sp.]